MLSIDFETQYKKKDPILFPGLMSQDNTNKLPPTIVITSEFDYLRRDALKFIDKLKKAERLLDVLDLPACT